ncbi:class I SAM-dependent methyltransferase [Paraeggerthella sp. Marseille-Q4926]|uniref:class I SAM-dependent methyltransferase n=1 Tax=Paraeggerthella sp. Marseille-Q4926 TaxID=2866587 RepID=UPI001CE3E37D|nr:class I SAM-dependent methyltransferase [Paraeggerthella sp. Marseille-Q4926]
MDDILPNAALLERSRAYWSQRAEEYSALHAASRHEALRDALRALLRDLMPRVEERPLRALDAGCGSGFMSLILAELGCDVTAVDFSEDMLAEAARNVARAGASGIELVHADVQHLSFDEGSFDFAVSRNVLWVLPDAAAAYAGIFRALGSGGVLVNLDANYGRAFNAAAEAGEEPVHPTQSAAQLRERNAIAADLPVTRAQRPAWDAGVLLGLGAQEVRCIRDAERLLGIDSGDRFSAQASASERAALFVVSARK